MNATEKHFEWTRQFVFASVERALASLQTITTGTNTFLPRPPSRGGEEVSLLAKVLVGSGGGTCGGSRRTTPASWHPPRFLAAVGESTTTKSKITNVTKSKPLSAGLLDPAAALLLLLAVPLAALGQANYATPYAFTTIAGLAGNSGSTDGTSSAARFYYPYGITVDTNGNVYVADTYNCTIRKVTPAGVVTTLAGLAGSPGSADGTGSGARFDRPYAVAVDGAGNVYVADSNNGPIRKVTPTGVVTTLAGLAGVSGSANGTGSAARFNGPDGVAVDTAGNVYVADTFNSTIRKVTPAGVVTTLAGLAGVTGSANGTGSAARFRNPYGVAVDSAGTLFVADSDNQTIRKVTPAGVVTTLAGLAGNIGISDGTGNTARFYSPDGLAVDGADNVYVADTFNGTIRKVTPAGVVTTLAGLAGFLGSDDGVGSAARFWQPYKVAVDTNGTVFAVDSHNHTIRKGILAVVVQVSASPTNGTVPLAVQFTSDSIDNAGNPITSWAWAFGDGSTSSVQNPSHTYTAEGTFLPGLTASNSLGSVVLAAVPSITTAYPTVAVTANPTDGTVPLTVQFTSASVDGTGNAITNWTWSFGDGATSSLQNPSHTYTAGGTFFPTLAASNSFGFAVVGSAPVIFTTLPTVEVTANPTSGTVPLTVHFTAASIDSSGNAITNWNWDFGDGSTSALQNPSHTYQTLGVGTNANGFFNPSLTGLNNLGVAVIGYVPYVTVSLPTVQFTADPTIGVPPVAVQFNSPGIDSAGNTITSWNWTFGDGSTSIAQSPSHTYSTVGYFQPGLIVTNGNGTRIVASGPTIETADAVYSGLVLNGGFETGSFFGWTLDALGGLYNLVDTFDQSNEGIQPYTGSYFARLGQVFWLGYLSQTLATTAGANYLLSFGLNSPDGQTPNQFQVSWNGAVLFSQTNLPAIGNDPATAWTNLQFVVTATAATTVLQFGFQDDPTAFGLDDISVVQISPTLTLQPQSQAVACQSNAQFTVAAAGPPPLHYQWRKNGAPLAGGTDTAYSVTPLTCQGPDSYSVVITNSGGSITSAVATLTVLDTNPPAINFPADIVLNTAPGQCSAIATYSASATDDCAVVSLAFNPASGALFPKGTNTVTCVATDCAGNTNTCSFTVAVVDNEPPGLTCPADQTMPAVGTNGVPVFFTATANDNCDGSVPVDCTPASGSTFGLGTSTVTCVANDSSGNTNTCSFTVTVTEAPPTLSIVLDGGNCLVSWLPTYSAHVLQQKAGLDPAAEWVPVDIPATWDGTSFVVALPLEQEARLFRLRRN